jgi:hypothetical protein
MSLLQSVFIENCQRQVQIQLFPLTTIVYTPPNSLIFSPNHTHQQLIVAFCLILHSLALSKRNAMTSRALLPMHNFLLHRFVDKLTVERSKLLWTFFSRPQGPRPSGSRGGPQTHPREDRWASGPHFLARGPKAHVAHARPQTHKST